MDTNIENSGTVSADGMPSRALTIPATIISYLFHPVFMPTVMAAVLFWLSPASFAGWKEAHMGIVLIRIAYSTLFFPLFTMLLLKSLGFIESIHMKNLKERIIPLMATMIFYFWAYHVSKNEDPPLILRILLLGSFWGIIALFMISIFVKISMHTTAAGGVLGILLVLMMMSPVNMAMPFFIALGLAGLIGTARLILRAHTPAEIWLGYIVGLLVQLGAYWYLN